MVHRRRGRRHHGAGSFRGGARGRRLYPAHLQGLPAPVLAVRESRRRRGRQGGERQDHVRRAGNREPWSTSRSTCSRPTSPRSRRRSASPRSTARRRFRSSRRRKPEKIPVIAFDSGVDSDIPVTTCRTDSVAAAATAADKMAEAIGGSGEVGVIVHDQTSRTGIDRRDGFVNRIKEKYPEHQDRQRPVRRRRPSEVGRNRQSDDSGEPEAQGHLRRQRGFG